MARITVEECLTQIPNRFELTLVAAYRAHQLANGAANLVENIKDKGTDDALRGNIDGKAGKRILNCGQP